MLIIGLSFALCFQNGIVFLNLLLVQGIPEQQNHGQQAKAQSRNQGGDAEDTALDGLSLTNTLSNGIVVIADGLQQPASKTRCHSLTQLPGEGV